jgi:hypothetical protein
VTRFGLGEAYSVCVIHVQNPTPLGINLLVALSASHAQTRVHVHVVAGEIQTDQALEDNTPSGKGRRKEHQQAGRGAAVGHHVKDCAECGGLVEMAGSETVKSIEETGYAVEEGAGARMERHVIEGGNSEDDA